MRIRVPRDGGRTGLVVLREIVDKLDLLLGYVSIWILNSEREIAS